MFVGIDRFCSARGTDLTEEKIASFLAMTAGLGANPTMIVGLAVRFAFVCAELAGDNAGVKLGVHEFVGRFGLTREYP